jgi:hypothetical protein
MPTLTCNLANNVIIKNAIILNIIDNISNFRDAEVVICVILVLLKRDGGLNHYLNTKRDGGLNHYLNTKRDGGLNHYLNTKRDGGLNETVASTII